MKHISRLLFYSCLCIPSVGFSKTFTIFHTNDEHSRFLGFAPDSEYNPEKKGDGTVGGVARLAKLLKEKRTAAKAKGPVLTLEGGDFSMGTLFQLITRQKAPELQFMKYLEYDAITLGNHEFDFGVKGLIQMLHSAIREVGTLPPIIASNLVLTKDDPRDADLREFVKKGVIKPYVVIEKEGTRFGILGVLGKDAVEVTANHVPVTFSDVKTTVKSLVETLRNKEKVDYIIVLSHSGVARPDPNWKGPEVLTVGDDGKWSGEDVELAEAVPEIDVIVSGHTHTPLVKPVMVGKTAVVQAGAEMRYLGELELESDGSRTKVNSYTLNPVNDQIIGESAVNKMVNDFKYYINETFLKPLKISFDQTVAKINSPATREYRDNSLGHLLSAAFQKATHSEVGFVADGMIRDDIAVGKTGVQSLSDIFRLIPLGVGEIDEDVGYPMIKIHVNGKEVKQVLETLLIAYKVKGSTYFPRFSGVEFTYNPYRVPLDRIVEAHLKKADGSIEEIDFNDEKRLYSIGTLSYIGKFFWIIPEVSMGLFNVVPKFADGTPIHDIKDSLVDGNGSKTTKEYKCWQALLDYIRTLPMDEATKLPVIPTDGEAQRSPMMEIASLNPADLFKNATWIQWSGSAAGAGVFFMLLSLLMWGRRKFSKRK